MKATLLFIFILFCLNSIFGQIQSDTTDGWYVKNTTGSVSVVKLRIVSDTSTHGTKCLSIYHKTDVWRDFGEVWIEKRFPLSKTPLGFVMSFNLIMTRPLLDGDGLTVYLWFGSDTTLHSTNGYSFPFDSQYIHWYEDFELSTSWPNPNPPDEYDRIQLRVFNTSNESEILFDKLYEYRSDTLLDDFGDEITDVVNPETNTPVKYTLFQNYPNPFNPTTEIEYEIPNTAFVELSVYDILGKKIRTLVNGEKIAGKHKVTFNASDLSNGIYFYTLRSGRFSETKKMVLIK